MLQAGYPGYATAVGTEVRQPANPMRAKGLRRQETAVLAMMMLLEQALLESTLLLLPALDQAEQRGWLPLMV